MTLIFHIISRDAALMARENGEYRAESLAAEGFIHFSGLHQLLGVANRFYPAQRGLVILAVDVSRLKAELKYEAPVHPATVVPVELPKDEDFSRGERLIDTALFPHLYGPLNFDAVIAIHDFEPNADGKFSLPATLNTKH